MFTTDPRSAGAHPAPSHTHRIPNVDYTSSAFTPFPSQLLHLTDSQSGESIYLNPSNILFIQQIDGCSKYPRRTRIDMVGTGQCFLVKEEADLVATASKRGFYRPAAQEQADA